MNIIRDKNTSSNGKYPTIGTCEYTGQTKSILVPYCNLQGKTIMVRPDVKRELEGKDLSIKYQKEIDEDMNMFRSIFFRR